MTDQTRQSRPELTPGAASKSIANDTSSIADAAPVGLVNGVYVVVVHTHVPGGHPRWTRRIYMSLHSAQRAQDRAVMRGARAYLVLCQLHAVDTRLGGAL